jgi:ABC-type uncharacterized transport system substrate-binding protein
MTAKPREVFRLSAGKAGRCRAAGCLWTVLLLLLAGTRPALCADLTVAVVRGESLLPYEEVLAGFEEGLKQQNLSAVFVTAEPGQEGQDLKTRISLLRPALILCLDLRALERVESIRNVPKIYALITAVNLAPYKERRDIRGVCLDIAPAAQFAILRQAFPEKRRVGVLYDPNHNRTVIEEARRAAGESGFTLQTYEVGAIQEIPQAFERLGKSADLLWTLYDPTVYGPEAARYVLMQSLQRRIPVVGFSPHFAKAGALLALYGDYRDMGRQAAGLVPQGDPVAATINRPRTVRMAANEKVGRFLGVAFSPAFTKRLHQIF